MYHWIKAAFRHFFNNVQKDPVVQVEGLRACRQLLAYLLREIADQRQRIVDGQPVDDTMLTRLVFFQLGRSSASVERPPDLDPRLVSDLRIAENVMGTIVGAVAGQEEATCRVIDSLIGCGTASIAPRGRGLPVRQLRRSQATGAGRSGRLGRLASRAPRCSSISRKHCGTGRRARCCCGNARATGARIADSRPIAAGTPVFVSHGWAMRDVPEPDAFVLDRPREHYLQYGWGRHTCLGQYVSPVIIVESMIALLGLQDLSRPEPAGGRAGVSLRAALRPAAARRSESLRDDLHIQFADEGTTQQFWPAV